MKHFLQTISLISFIFILSPHRVSADGYRWAEASPVEELKEMVIWSPGHLDHEQVNISHIHAFQERGVHDPRATKTLLRAATDLVVWDTDKGNGYLVDQKSFTLNDIPELSFVVFSRSRDYLKFVSYPEGYPIGTYASLKTRTPVMVQDKIFLVYGDQQRTPQFRFVNVETGEITIPKMEGPTLSNVKKSWLDYLGIKIRWAGGKNRDVISFDWFRAAAHPELPLVAFTFCDDKYAANGVTGPMKCRDLRIVVSNGSVLKEVHRIPEVYNYSLGWGKSALYYKPETSGSERFFSMKPDPAGGYTSEMTHVEVPVHKIEISDMLLPKQ